MEEMKDSHRFEPAELELVQEIKDRINDAGQELHHALYVLSMKLNIVSILRRNSVLKKEPHEHDQIL